MKIRERPNTLAWLDPKESLGCLKKNQLSTLIKTEGMQACSLNRRVLFSIEARGWPMTMLTIPVSDAVDFVLMLILMILSWRHVSYLSFHLITQASYVFEIFYTQNAWFLTKLNWGQKSVNRSNDLCKIIHWVQNPFILSKITHSMFDNTMKLINSLHHL